MLAVILGLVFIMAGGCGVLVWKGDFIIVLKGLVPFMFVVGGVISIVAGITNITESFESKTGDDNPPAENKEK